jgi:type IV secretion system protein VirB6
MDACSAARAGSGFVSSMTGFIDCQAQNLGFGAWAALGMPGSTLQVVLTGFLTIFIALIGYRLLLGSTFTIRETTLAFIKIGAVFALATSWAAYRPLVYDLVTDGPGQLVSEIGPSAGITGSDGTLLQRLDYADRNLEQLAILGAGYPSASEAAQTAPSPFIGFDSFALGGSRIVFLFSAIAGLAIVRIVTALMLALGPFFVAFFLFDSTRSLFEGWVRVLAGAGFATIAVSIALGLELGLMEPWLSSVLARRMSGEPMPAVPTELFVIAGFFALAVLASLFFSMRIAYAFRLPRTVNLQLANLGRQRDAGSAVAARAAAPPKAAAEAGQTRAAALAATFSTLNRRERLALLDAGVSGAPNARSVQLRSAEFGSASRAAPLGRSFTRRSGRRVSAMAMKRDAAS